ncbi:MAG: hypothetical protein DRK00_03760 [Thermoprotei archaeon]|nr:MAG: hypothetical protein DRK00_03760 [Thermoprotei archaeon]
MPYYWGYEVRAVASLREAVEASRGCLRVATSRKGEPLRRVAGRLVRAARERGVIALFFGAREKGLFELAEDEGLDVHECFDYVVNLVPQQGTYTIRTEEAVPIALAIIDFLLD